MSKVLKVEAGTLKRTCFINNAHNLLSSLQKAEFQHLRLEFEQILDDYLEKSTLLSDEEMPGLINNTAVNIKVILRKAATLTRFRDSWENDITNDKN